MSADRPLAEIVAEGRRQAPNFSTVILDREDALRLLAVAEKAMEAEIVVRNILTAHEASLTERGTLSYSSPAGSTGFIAAIHWLEAFDALAAPAPEGEGR